MDTFINITIVSAVFRIIVLLHLSTFCYGQFSQRMTDQVLKTSKIDSTFIFGKWSPGKGETTEVHLTYLGSITDEKQSYDIMTYVCYFGASSRSAASRVLVFDKSMDFLGSYRVGMIYDLPEEIKGNCIMFYHANSDKCDPGAETSLSFEDGIPPRFFLPCQGKLGDLFVFDTTAQWF